MKKTILVLITVILTALMLTACAGGKVKAPPAYDPKGRNAQITTVIQSDGSGEMSFAYRRNFLKERYGSSKNVCNTLEDDLPKKTSVEEQDIEGETVCVGSLTFNKLYDLEDRYAELNQAGIYVSIKELKISDGQLAYNLSVDPGYKLTWKLVAPGTMDAQANNANEHKGQVLVWDLANSKTLRAKSQWGGGSPLLWLIPVVCLCGFLVVVAVGVVVFIVLKRRQQPAVGEAS